MNIVKLIYCFSYKMDMVTQLLTNVFLKVLLCKPKVIGTGIRLAPSLTNFMFWSKKETSFSSNLIKKKPQIDHLRIQKGNNLKHK
jgi:hypothetical protein